MGIKPRIANALRFLNGCVFRIYGVQVSESVENAKFKLDEAKYYYEQMRVNFQDRRAFLFNLDAFLSAARAVTFVFKKGREKMNEALVKLYDDRVEGEWKADKVMRLLINMRNVSIKEHTPQMQTTPAVDLSSNVTIVGSITIKKVSPDGKVEERTVSPNETIQQPEVKSQAPAANAVISRSFYKLPDWFDQDSDIMHLCREWLAKLEGFIAEAEKMVSVQTESKTCCRQEAYKTP
jgi:hypothetical protein